MFGCSLHLHTFIYFLSYFYLIIIVVAPNQILKNCKKPGNLKFWFCWTRLWLKLKSSGKLISKSRVDDRCFTESCSISRYLCLIKRVCAFECLHLLKTLQSCCTFLGIHAYSLPLRSCGIPLPSLFTSPPDMVLLAHRKVLLLFKWSNGKCSYSSPFLYLPSFYYLYLKAFLFKDSFNPVSCIFYC